MLQHRVTTLKNGLHLITIPMPGIESVTVMVGAGVGSRHERRRINGLSHMLEHMAFKGTKKRPTTAAIATEVDSVGGEQNAFTDKEVTAYYIKLPRMHIKLAFDILADMLANSLFKEEEIEKEKGVVIQEINMYEDTPRIQIQNDFIRLLYGDNPMGWDTAGSKKSVAGLKKQDFLDHIQRYYFPQNMVVAVAGNFKGTLVTKFTKEYFGNFRRQHRKVTEKIKPDQDRPRLKLHYKKTEQAHFCLGMPAYPLSHPDRFTAGILSTILGGGMSSRLFIKIRERRGLAYYVDCVPEYFTDSGFLMVSAGVRLDKIDEALKITLDELDDLTNKKVTTKELKKSQELIKGRYALALEESQFVATKTVYHWLLEEKIWTLKEIWGAVDRVTVGDCLRVAKDVFRPQKLNLAVIGPYKDEAQFKKLLR